MKARRSLCYSSWGLEVDLLQLFPFSIGNNFSRLNDQMLVQLEVPFWRGIIYKPLATAARQVNYPWLNPIRMCTLVKQIINLSEI